MEFFIKEEFNTKWVYVKNDANLSICFCSFGASVYSLDFYNEPVILKFASKEDFLYSKGFHGKTLGRVILNLKKVFNMHFMVEAILHFHIKILKSM